MVNFAEKSYALLEFLPVALCIRDSNGAICFENKAYQNMMRRSHQEVISESAPFSLDGLPAGSLEVYHDISEISRLKQELEQLNQRLRKAEIRYAFQDIIGNDPDLLHTIKIAKGAAITPATILLRGESGTGKEIFANAIHNHSPRRHQPFVKVNCTSLPETLLESELFGYVSGAFTGARTGGRKGLFQEAHKGTLFLDEIGDISSAMQTKLLRVLQEKEIIPVGSSKAISLDVRIICATNRNLEDMLEKGSFREDLYYRLNVFPLFIPPLRKRKGDIEAISHHLIARFNEQYGRHVDAIEPAALSLLQMQPWRGNVRELENVLARTMLHLSEGENRLSREALLPHLGALMPKPVTESGEGRTLADVLEETERICLINAINRNGGDKNKAAAELNLPLRTFYYRCRKLGI